MEEDSFFGSSALGNGEKRRWSYLHYHIPYMTICISSV